VVSGSDEGWELTELAQLAETKESAEERSDDTAARVARCVGLPERRSAISWAVEQRQSRGRRNPPAPAWRKRTPL